MQDRTPDPSELDPIERASNDELQALQLDRLKATLGRVYEHVAHYRSAFDAAGVHPGDLRELADLARFPFTSKADLRENYPFGMFAVPREQVARLHASSGTTGRPTVVGYTAGGHRDLGGAHGPFHPSVGRPSRRHRPRGLRVRLVHRRPGRALRRRGARVHGGSCPGGMTERQVMLIQDFRPDVIMVTPSYMLAIVEELEKQKIDPRETSLQVGIFGAEPWTNDMRLELEQRLDMHAVDIYGLSEVMGPGVANECVETKDGLHIWEDHFYPEVIDPVTGDVLPDGERGELVFTTLTKQAMPVVRYRTRDLTRLMPGTARTMRRMEKITGRTDDMIILRGVNCSRPRSKNSSSV